MANPTGKGGWVKGQSGNPSGRARTTGALSVLAADESENSIKLLIQIRDDAKATKALRVAAANSILDRGMGKPPQAVHATGDGNAVYVARLPMDFESMDEWLEQTKPLRQ